MDISNEILRLKKIVYYLSRQIASGGGGGGGTWGSITGTLSDQTDLQTELTARQPLDSDLTAIAALTPSNDDFIQRKAGAWTNRTIAQVNSDLALVNDTVYGAGWNGDTAIAPSKNAVYDKMELMAPLASPTFTGTPAAPTAAGGTNTTQIATTAYVQGEIVTVENYALATANYLQLNYF